MSDLVNPSSLFLTVLTSLIMFTSKSNKSSLDLYEFPNPELNNTYDFIIIGAGSAGSVVANRLSEVDDWRILLIEAGGEEDIISDTPMLASTLWNTQKDWNYTTVEQKHACRDREGLCQYPRGHVLGGSSTLNFMNYVRGNKWDYDNWKNQGNDGWSYEEILPYFLKSEDMTIEELALDKEHHSTGGYLTVEKGRHKSVIQNDFVKAATEIGFSLTDFNGKFQTGIGYPQFTMRKGTRCSTAKAFLSNIKNRRNIHIAKHTLAEKIVLNENNDVATEVTLLKDGQQFKVQVEKEVIVSAGAINTPKLLMLSGIGPKEHLNEVGIATNIDLPVGNNLVDHACILLFFKVEDNVTITKNTIERMDTILEYVYNRSGPLSSIMAMDAIGHFNLDRSNKSLPDFQSFMTSFTPYQFVDPVLMMTVTKLRPKSVGTVRLKSSNPKDQPNIDPHFLEEPSDFEDSVNGCLFILDFMKTTALSKYDPKTFAGGTECDGKEGIEYCRCVVPIYSITMYHPTGTARMSKDGVVSPTLNVWGVKNLRVVDASVMPNITSGNTNAAIIMIGEKAADIIKKHWDVI